MSERYCFKLNELDACNECQQWKRKWTMVLNGIKNKRIQGNVEPIYEPDRNTQF